MALSLDQYATYLDTRGLPWPAAPQPVAPKVRPHIQSLEGVKAVLWTVYGTLLAIPEGDLKFEVENDFMMNVALDKTIHEFKMWGSMSRKPGQPSEYMREIYKKALAEQRLMPSEDKYPELPSEKIWEGILKKLFQKDYKFDASFFGALNEYAKKVAYFFHASLQGTGAYPNAAAAVKGLSENGMRQGLLADGQCFTTTQLARGLVKQDESVNFDALIPTENRALSFATKARKPSDLLLGAAVEAMGNIDIEPHEILHVGSSLTRDIGPAKKWGMRTALYAGDKNSLEATGEQLKDPQYRPDALLTDLEQVLQLVG
ncbi:MAG TPA: HAD hydrolase-like protein [Gemmataceae bacterium]|jgi:FMN phosphatase YigB (HAD superfamily)|nr:HAD hydrolase-like protein [Gemmataceae bacterium]